MVNRTCYVCRHSRLLIVTRGSGDGMRCENTERNEQNKKKHLKAASRVTDTPAAAAAADQRQQPQEEQSTGPSTIDPPFSRTWYSFSPETYSSITAVFRSVLILRFQKRNLGVCSTRIYKDAHSSSGTVCTGTLFAVAAVQYLSVVKGCAQNWH